VNDILKQRLVGALILIALGVVFWPIIFVEQGSKPLGETTHIPVRPSVDTQALEAPGKEGLRSSPPIEMEKEVEPADVPEEPQLAPQGARPAPPPAVVTTRTQAPVKPALDANGVPIGWILQVASIGNPEKAEQLRRRLVDMGYKAYVKKIKSGDAVLLRVYIGPKFERARLEEIKIKVDAEFRVKSMVRRYIP